jgi:hypothetical protein
MTNRKPKEKDAINQLLDNFDLHGMTQDEIAGPTGLDDEEINKKNGIVNIRTVPKCTKFI